MMIDALKSRLALLEEDLTKVEPQSMQNLCLVLNGRKIVGADEAGEALRELVKSAKAEMRAGVGPFIERIVGRFGGFELGVCGGRGDEIPMLLLSGRCRHEAERYQTAPGLVAALLTTLNSIEEQHTKVTAQLAARSKRLEDLRLELDRPFEHELRLTDLLVRQRELAKTLELDQDEAGSRRADSEESRRAA